MAATVGIRVDLSSDLSKFLDESYHYWARICFEGPRYGRATRYRRNGKKLVPLHPEDGSYTFLVVRGSHELEKTRIARDDLIKRVWDMLEKAEPRCVGRWLWITAMSE